MTLTTKRETLEQELQNIEAAAEGVRKQLRELEEMTPAQRVALEFHETQCQWDHTDQCSFFYTKDWKSVARQDWVKKAEAALKIADEETVLALNSVINS